MSTPDDPTRPTRPAAASGPSADQPGTPGANRPAPQPPASPRPAPPEAPAKSGKAAGVWVALILGAVVLVLLLIFVIQNNQTANFHYFTASFDLPLGVAMLFAAIAGALVMAAVGSVWIVQMSWALRKLRKQLDKGQR